MESNSGIEQVAPLKNSTVAPQGNETISKPKKGGLTIAGIILMIAGLLPGICTAATALWAMATGEVDRIEENKVGWVAVILLWVQTIPAMLGMVLFVTGIIMFFVGRSKDKKRVDA